VSSMQRLRAVTAGGMTATVALLVGVPPSAAQGGPGAGSYPGSFLIPGTNTSFSVGGYVKLDYFYDFTTAGSTVGGLSGGIGIPLDAGGGHPATAGHSIHGVSQITASESRFNIQTRTPTAYGEVKTFIEGDFTNPSGLTNGSTFTTESDSSGFRLRQAYGTIGPFLAGQTFSTMRDLNAEPETLDFGGDNALGANRQPQIRYTYDAGNGLALIGAIENPTTTFTDATVAAGTATTFNGSVNGSKIPDFVLGGVFTQPWGHISLRGVFRDLYDHQGGSTGLGTGNGLNTSTSEFGYGAALGGDFKTWGKDDVVAQVFGGEGIGRYLSTNCSASGCPDMYVNNSTNRAQAVSAWGVVAGYQHFWADNLRSNISGSYIEFQNDGGFVNATAFTGLNKHYITGHVNLIWSPIPSVDTGAEFIYAEREIEDGQTGENMRFQYSAKWKF
jgi:hypothetical protein